MLLRSSVYNERDDLPPIESLKAMWEDDFTSQEFVINGLLRRGEKMILSGASKAGKSFALTELAVSIASGTQWLGNYSCTPNKVLYVNLEIDRASFLHRIYSVSEALHIPGKKWLENFTVWNLRGYVLERKRLIDQLINAALSKNAKVVILDPIYKMGTGNENSAREIAMFCDDLDKVATEAGCAVIYCHHHPKGNQSWKRPIDRAAGSGVFARDADVVLDIIELELPEKRRRKGIDAWRFTPICRNLPPQPPVDVWFNFPIHELEHFDHSDGVIAPHHELPAYQRAMNGRKSKEEKLRERNHRLEAAFDIVTARGDIPSVKAISDYLGVSERTVRNSVAEHQSFFNENGIIKRK